MLRIEFGQLSAEDAEFLKARVDVKLCPDCNLKAEYLLVDGNVMIDNVCCENFAITIGDSITIKNINAYAIEFRGKILNTFCILERYIDQIISMTVEQYPVDFNVDGVPQMSKDINMRERKQLFKLSLNKYQELTTNNIDKIWGQFCILLEKRNVLAHWPVDTSSSALELLERSNRIKFVNMSGNWEEETFNSMNTFNLVGKIEKLNVDIIDIFQFFHNRTKK